jgi:hypothetical protein
LSHKRFTALVAATSTLVACTTPPATTDAPTSAELGTVSPAYPVGTDLEPGVAVLKAVPVAILFTTEPVPFDATDVCAAVPADVVTPAGFASTPVSDSEPSCVWHGSGLAVEIGILPYSMAKTIEEHLAMANGGSTDRLAHLAWLRIDDHYAIERILEFDRTKSCWLSLDVHAPATVHTVVYRIDPATGEPAESDAETSVSEICPVARQSARSPRRIAGRHPTG